MPLRHRAVGLDERNGADVRSRARGDVGKLGESLKARQRLAHVEAALDIAGKGRADFTIGGEDGPSVFLLEGEPLQRREEELAEDDACGAAYEKASR